jgi:Ser/Thr protein kinase RdoA (MazF antagonist)
MKGLSYLQQVRQLRKTAEEAVKSFPIKVADIQFVNHGENTTFKIATRSKDYLLRIHRPQYHTEKAIIEELKWLKKLSENPNIPAQKPIPTTEGPWLCTAGNKGDVRKCSLLTWMDGRELYKGLTPNAFFKTGLLTAELHVSTHKLLRPKNRNYWTPEGLLGNEAQLGAVKALRGEFADSFSTIENARRLIYKHVDNFYRDFPERQGLIHADLHFGNIIWKQGQPIPIDFDDCGWGIHLFDLAVTLAWSDHFLHELPKKEANHYVESILEGYQQVIPLGYDDIVALPWFLHARQMQMLGWYASRQDHPRIWKHFKKRKKAHLRGFEKLLSNGPRKLFY